MTVDRSALEVPTLIEALQTLVEALPEWSMAVDAGWSSRGFAAQPCSLPIVWYENQRVALHELVPKPTQRKGKIMRPGN